MARRKPATVNPEDLTPREGKVLRYFVSRNKSGDNQTAADACIVEIEWTDLPHNHKQALLTLSSLVAKGLMLNVHEDQYTPTTAGIALIDKAKGMWNAPPPPSVTNAHVEHIDPVLKPYKSKKPAAKQAAKPKPKAKPKAKPKPKPKAKGVIRIKKAR